VALRPEPFGALVYHFGTRRLAFLKTPQLVTVVSGLAEHPDVHSALARLHAAAAVDPALAVAFLRVAGLIDHPESLLHTVHAVMPTVTSRDDEPGWTETD
jgi:putative mycofactocin binding protein MftB